MAAKASWYWNYVTVTLCTCILFLSVALFTERQFSREVAFLHAWEGPLISRPIHLPEIRFSYCMCGTGGVVLRVVSNQRTENALSRSTAHIKSDWKKLKRCSSTTLERDTLTHPSVGRLNDIKWRESWIRGILPRVNVNLSKQLGALRWLAFTFQHDNVTTINVLRWNTQLSFLRSYSADVDEKRKILNCEASLHRWL